jgi:prepilin-type N-terminal cleavage/methylation domain-containing protein
MIFITAKLMPVAAKHPLPLGEGAALHRQITGTLSLSQRARRRSAFTLLEMMLVLALMAGMGAMAWPLVSRMYDSVKLRNVAEQIQAAFGHARVQAMTSGLPQVFHFEANTGNYSIDVWQDGTESTEGSSASSSTASGGFSASNPTSSTSGSTTAASTSKLPDGFIFTAAERVLDNRAAVSEAGLSGTGIDTSTPPVLFYPDGTTSEAQVTIANQNGRCINVVLRGLTGLAKLGEMSTTEAAGGTGT